MSEKKDQLKEILKDQLNREAKQIEEEVGLNDNEEIPNELKIRMKNALDQKIREREMRSEDMKRTDAYAKLSEEDQEALRLGREMMKNQSEEKKIYTMRRKKRNIRRIVALAAVLILVMAVGMTSFGGPERMLQFMKSSVCGRKVSQVDSSDKNKVIEEEDEEKAYEKIEKEFGIAPVRLWWYPENMEFENMILDTDIQVAEVDYLYKDKKIEYFVSASYGEVSWGYDNEDKKIDYIILGNHYYQTDELHQYFGSPVNEYYLKAYVDHCIQAIDTGLYSYIAHPDLVYYDPDSKLYQEEMSRLCAYAKEKDMPLEFNLLGFMSGRHYPNESFWKIASKYKNKAIIGFDAHSPDALLKDDIYQQAFNYLSSLDVELIDTIKTLKNKDNVLTKKLSRI